MKAENGAISGIGRPPLRVVAKGSGLHLPSPSLTILHRPSLTVLDIAARSQNGYSEPWKRWSYEECRLYQTPWLDGIRWIGVPMAYHGVREPGASDIFGIDVGLVLFGALVIPLAWIFYKIWRKKR